MKVKTKGMLPSGHFFIMVLLAQICASWGICHHEVQLWLLLLPNCLNAALRRYMPACISTCIRTLWLSHMPRELPFSHDIQSTYWRSTDEWLGWRQRAKWGKVNQLRSALIGFWLQLWQGLTKQAKVHPNLLQSSKPRYHNASKQAK